MFEDLLAQWKGNSKAMNMVAYRAWVLRSSSSMTAGDKQHFQQVVFIVLRMTKTREKWYEKWLSSPTTH